MLRSPRGSLPGKQATPFCLEEVTLINLRTRSKQGLAHAVLQPVLLRRTGRLVIGWSAWGREGAFGLSAASEFGRSGCGVTQRRAPGADLSPPVPVK